MPKLSLQYIAGLIDGEGTLVINKHQYKSHPNRNLRYVPNIRINMVDLKPLRLIREQFGGSIYHNKISRKNPNWRDTFMWNVTSSTAIRFLNAIYPYLIIKKKQADILYKLYDTISSSRESRSSRKSKFLTNEVVKEREKLFRDIKAIKRISVM